MHLANSFPSSDLTNKPLAQLVNLNMCNTKLDHFSLDILLATVFVAKTEHSVYLNCEINEGKVFIHYQTFSNFLFMNRNMNRNP